MRHSLITTFALTLAMVAPVAAQNLVNNPGFEAGDFSGWMQGGNTDFTEVVASDFANTGAFEARFGPFGTDGTLSQSISTTPGAQYLFDFWLDNEGEGPNSFAVLWGGSPLLTLSSVVIFDYTYYAFTVAASGPTTAIAFQFQNEPDYWYLDDVGVSELEGDIVPEPATMTLLATGLVGMAAARRRKRHTS